MTKSLTEKWKDGTLEGGFYYILVDGEKYPLIDHTDYNLLSHQVEWKIFDWHGVKEVVDEVPSYSEYQALKYNCETIHTCWKGANEKIKKLQEQLKEANDIIISVAAMPRFPVNPELCREYLKKWSVK